MWNAFCFWLTLATFCTLIGMLYGVSFIVSHFCLMFLLFMLNYMVPCKLRLNAAFGKGFRWMSSCKICLFLLIFSNLFSNIIYLFFILTSFRAQSWACTWVYFVLKLNTRCWNSSRIHLKWRMWVVELNI